MASIRMNDKTFLAVVATSARRALDSGNVNLVLPWVREQDEAQVREAERAAHAH